MKLETELGLDKPFEDTYHETLLNIIRTGNLLSSMGSELFRQYGLTDAQFNVLMALKYKEGALTQVALGRRLVVTRASVTSVLDRLESKGLVCRKTVAGNRRIYHVELTASGEELITRIEPVYRQEIHEIFSVLGKDACKDLTSVLETIREQIRMRWQASV